MPRLVKFRYNEKEKDLFAFFPKKKWDLKTDLKTCFSHVGQHSSCSIEYVKESRPATESEYLPLLNELKSIGYNLKICK